MHEIRTFHNADFHELKLLSPAFVYAHSILMRVEARHIHYLDGHDVRSLDQRLRHHSAHVMIHVIELLWKQLLVTKIQTLNRLYYMITWSSCGSVSL